MKRILLLTNEERLKQDFTLALAMLDHKVITAKRGDVGYAILAKWRPDMIIVGELEDCHAGSVAHTLTMRSKARPYMVAVYRTFGNDLANQKYRIRCTEMGFDVAVMLPVFPTTIQSWCNLAQIKEVDPWFGGLSSLLVSSSSGGSCG